MLALLGWLRTSKVAAVIGSVEHVDASVAGEARGSQLPRLKSSSDLELTAFIQACGGDRMAACEALEAKQRWYEREGPFRVPQEVYRSEGYIVALEGLCDASGDPLVYAFGMPHGTCEEVVQQVAYVHERVIAQCIANNRPAIRATTLVNVRSPTFRFPDAAMRASITVGTEYYPWSTRGKTIFVGVPAPMRWCFELCRPFMSDELFASITLVDQQQLRQVCLPSLPVRDVARTHTPKTHTSPSELTTPRAARSAIELARCAGRARAVGHGGVYCLTLRRGGHGAHQRGRGVQREAARPGHFRRAGGTAATQKSPGPCSSPRPSLAQCASSRFPTTLVFAGQPGRYGSACTQGVEADGQGSAFLTTCLNLKRDGWRFGDCGLGSA